MPSLPLSLPRIFSHRLKVWHGYCSYGSVTNKTRDMLTNEKKTALAKKAFNAIKKTITEQKKIAKQNPKGPDWARVPVADLGITLAKGWIGAKDEKYRLTLSPIKYGEKEKHIIESDTKTDLNDIIRSLFGLLNKQMEVKGWTTLKVVRDKAHFGDWRCGYDIEYPSRVTLCDAPCKEYTSLQNYINKYGKAPDYYGRPVYNVNLRNYDIFRSAMGGKRGMLWDEYGDRNYLDNRPNTCKEILAELREMRGAKDIMLCKMGEENWIDPVDEAYSIRHEIECEGQKRHYLLITIKTPAGKVKYEKKIF